MHRQYNPNEITRQIVPSDFDPDEIRYQVIPDDFNPGQTKVIVNVLKLTDTATIPARGSDESAGYDIYADEDVVIPPHSRHCVHTGLAMEIPKGYFGGIYARSGIALKNGVRPSNCVGVIDSDYRGEIGVALTNDSDDEFKIKTGYRIAQLIIHKLPNIEFIEVDALSNTVRSDGGFGSTGVSNG